MKQTAVVVAPGRGTYNRGELGYIKRHHSNRADLIAQFDTHRAEQDQVTISALDGADKFSPARHLRGDNASGLIHACAYADFLAIDRDRFDILAVTGNSMGWYIALACAGALSPMDGFKLVNTMGALMQSHMIGGQVIYPCVDENWQAVPGQRDEIMDKMREIDARPDHVLTLSIDLGGMLVLAGNEAGLSVFEAEMPMLQGRFPLRLPGHAGFHSHLQAPVAAEARNQIGADIFQSPNLPLIDGRGAIWHPNASDTLALHGYTLGHQVVEPYDFNAAIRVAAREIMPDVFIVLGPGSTLGASVGQSLISTNWRGMTKKADFSSSEGRAPVMLSMGLDEHRILVAG